MIYHYCTEKVFNKIIETKTIWLSDISKMNDKEEYQIGYHILLELLKDHGLDNHVVVTEMADINLNKTFHILIGCFSKDGDVLSQWRAYADDGRGFSIGFDELEIKTYNQFNRFSDNEFKPIMSSVEFINVNYDLDSFKAQAIRIIEHYKNSSSEIKYKILARELMYLSISYKDKFFIEEDEVRAVITPEHNYDQNYQISTRDTPYGSAFYHELNTSYEQCHSIKNIIFGPKNINCPYEIKKLLDMNGLRNVEITFSRGAGKYR